MNLISKTACIVIVAMPLAALAQASASAPAASAEAAPQLRYQSAFSGYRRYQDPPLADWRQVNDAVGAAASRGQSHGSHDAPAGEAAATLAPAGRAPAASEPLPMHQQGSHDMPGGPK